MNKLQNLVTALLMTTVCVCNAQNTIATMQPENGAMDVNIDTHLTLTMKEDVKIGQKGFISVFDKKTGKLVDRLDISGNRHENEMEK